MYNIQHLKASAISCTFLPRLLISRCLIFLYTILHDNVSLNTEAARASMHSRSAALPQARRIICIAAPLQRTCAPHYNAQSRARSSSPSFLGPSLPERLVLALCMYIYKQRARACSQLSEDGGEGGVCRRERRAESQTIITLQVFRGRERAVL